MLVDLYVQWMHKRNLKPILHSLCDSDLVSCAFKKHILKKSNELNVVLI